MISRKKQLEKSRLYCIIDKKVCARICKDLKGFILKIRKAGINLIQYRDKESRKEDVLKNARLISRALSGSKILFIINDYLDIAQIASADGVHLGQGDISLEAARRILGKDKIIGISTHTLGQAEKAANAGADYISVGPVYRTATKPQYRPVGLRLIKKTSAKIKTPFFAIGGINAGNLREVSTFGGKRIAVCRAICKAADPAKTVKNFKNILFK